MINCLSIRCSLAFAPYLLDGVAEFTSRSYTPGKLVKQGGFGMTFRSDGELVLHHQNRESRLGVEEASHYRATIDFRRECFGVVRTADEVILATVGNELFLSHPQSDIWLDTDAVSEFVDAFGGQTGSGSIGRVTYSVAGGRLMISDQHNGRWVLLGSDHAAEMKSRLSDLRKPCPADSTPKKPPTLVIKGVTIHLQSAFKLAESLREFSATGEFVPFIETLPTYALRVDRTSQGMEINDGDNKAALMKREAAKWVDIIAAELEDRNARLFERGGIRTVIADDPGGKWVLQWGDEIFLPDRWPTNKSFADGVSTDMRTADQAPGNSRLRTRVSNGRALVLDLLTGACVALTAEEYDA